MLIFIKRWFVGLVLLTLLNASSASSSLDLTEENLDLTLSEKNFVQSEALEFSSRGINSLPLTMKLKRIEVFSPETQIIVHTKEGDSLVTAPQTAYFEGTIENQEDSHVFIDFSDKANIKGIISLQNKNYFYQSKLSSSKVRESTTKEITNDLSRDELQCDLDSPNFREKSSSRNLVSQPSGITAKLASSDKTTYIANLTLESDYEYYSLFNDTTKAIKYAADLTAFTSSIYKKELNAILKIKKLNIYVNNNNPWQAADTSGLLDSLQAYYKNNNLITQKDSAVHLLSGKRIGGLAYVGSLCNGASNLGVSGGLYGSFDLNNPQIVWDAKVFAHELGHNFGAIHTHNYSPQPVDCCYSENTGSVCANYEPYTQLPGLHSLTGGEPERGTGTIMSYCHKVTGKLKNISLTLGRNHPYGIEPDRVPDAMRATLVIAKQYYPQCLATYFPGFAASIAWSDKVISASDSLVVGDFNGDNQDDVMDFLPKGKANLMISLSSSTGFGVRQPWFNDFLLNGTTPFVGDFNGDGKDEILKLPIINNGLAILTVSTGSSFRVVKQWRLTKPEAQGQYLIGDFNGDQKSDLGFLAKTSNKFYMALSTGDSFAAFQTWGTNLGSNPQTIRVGDFNGDRKDDLVLVNTSNPNNLYVSLSTGSQFKPMRLWGTTQIGEMSNFINNDFNGDKIDDILYNLKSDPKVLYVMLSNKTNFEASQNIGTLNSSVQDKFYTGKFDSDKAADILTISNESPAALGVMSSLVR